MASEVRPAISEAEWRVLSRVLAALRRSPKPRRVVLEVRSEDRVDVYHESPVGGPGTAA